MSHKESPSVSQLMDIWGEGGYTLLQICVGPPASQLMCVLCIWHNLISFYRFALYFFLIIISCFRCIFYLFLFFGFLLCIFLRLNFLKVSLGSQQN